MSFNPSSFEPPQDEDEMNIIQKMIFKCKQQPLVPIGTFATVGAIALAAKSIRKGDRVKTQFYYRLRIMFQLGTIAALVVGGYMYRTEEHKHQITKEEKLRAKAKLRESLWIEELERRDAEIQARKKKFEESKSAIQSAGEEAFRKQKEEDNREN